MQGRAFAKVSLGLVALTLPRQRFTVEP
jgi:hypothetical protein